MPQPASLRVGAWKTSHLVVFYVLFALLSTAMNLGTQQIAVMALTGLVGPVLPLSILCGTAAGFVSKYLLDKNFIFFDQSRDGIDETRKVMLYGFFSVFTTALFWGAEIGFLRVFGTAEAKYTGAVVGLALGYALKFVLDRRFTFTGSRL